jgi:DNA-binding FadR family transcriptional regulator
VAAALRKRIVSGAIEDGGMLPKQEDLMAEFGISLPPMREALRILETEGLITVRRGTQGGARVHVPTVEMAAGYAGLVLQSNGATLAETERFSAQPEMAVADHHARRPQAPALEIAQMYGSRWEHELYFRDVKRHLRKTALLQSHTVETGAQEIAAVVLASALLATERARAAPPRAA